VVEWWRDATVEPVVVCVGSALGGAARFWLSGFVGRRVGETFPWGTMAVNVSGAGVIGVVAAAAAAGAVGTGLWHFAAWGFLGSYTTVSSFSLQTLTLAREGEGGRAAVNVVLSLGLCLLAAGLGFLAGASLAEPG
jgi:fluoride exporter